MPLDQPWLGGDAAMDLYYEQRQHRVDGQELQDVQDAADVVAVLLVTRSEQGPAGAAWLDSFTGAGPAAGVGSAGHGQRRVAAGLSRCAGHSAR
jgi:hypothetical protein